MKSPWNPSINKVIGSPKVAAQHRSKKLSITSRVGQQARAACWRDIKNIAASLKSITIWFMILNLNLTMVNITDINTSNP